MPDFSFENKTNGTVVGIDEVGRGPWAGPVITCAFTFNDRSFFLEYLSIINDSKKLSEKNKLLLFDIFQNQKNKSCSFEIGSSSVEEIDKLNIRQATLLAMQRSYEKLEINADLVLIDGNDSPNLPVKTISVIKGDQKSYSIAASSIIAKVTRDKLMANLSKDYPYYSWEKNAGYGTKAHKEGLDLHGITKHHRKSFKPIKNLLSNIQTF